MVEDLFDAEKLAPDRLLAADREGLLNHRQSLRETKSRKLIDEIREWLYGQSALPESSSRKAIKYTMKLWPGLGPRIPIHNNLVERQLRGPVVGRKNHYGSKSQRGTEVASIFYTLIATCQLCGVDPTEYLYKATMAAIGDPNAVILPSDLM